MYSKNKSIDFLSYSIVGSVGSVKVNYSCNEVKMDVSLVKVVKKLLWRRYDQLKSNVMIEIIYFSIEFVEFNYSKFNIFICYVT